MECSSGTTTELKTNIMNEMWWIDWRALDVLNFTIPRENRQRFEEFICAPIVCCR